MNFLLKRLGLLLYGFASLLESILNIILYVTFLDNVRNQVFDFSVPFYFWWCDKVLKTGFLKAIKKENDIDG